MDLAEWVPKQTNKTKDTKKKCLDVVFYNEWFDIGSTSPNVGNKKKSVCDQCCMMCEKYIDCMIDCCPQVVRMQF